LNSSIIFAQNDSKVATLTVSGSGKSQDEAKQNALRNAIEQAFGTFITSNTQILNDQLLKDEIVSISNGNIQEYTVISEVQTPDGSWSNTVKAKVAIDKLTSFCESKGVNSEFKGKLFALNIKQQELNEKNEETAIENMCNVLKKLIENCFDYEISAGNPVQSNDGSNNWDIPLTVIIKPNNNLKIISDYFVTTLKGIAVNDIEVSNYKQLGKKIYNIKLMVNSVIKNDISNNAKVEDKKNKRKKATPNYDLGTPIETSKTKDSLINIWLRNEKSGYYINDFLAYFTKGLLNFKIESEVDFIYGSQFNTETEGDFVGQRIKFDIFDKGFKPKFEIQYGENSIFKYDNHFQNYVFKDDYGRGAKYRVMDGYPLTFADLPINEKVVMILFVVKKNTEEISKITGYKIEPCKNRLVLKEEYGFNTYRCKIE